MEWGPQGREVYERTYSRVKADGTNEVWSETVERVVDGNLALAPDLVEEGEREALIHHLYEMKALPAGRHLWTSGASGKTFNRNCHRAGFGPTLADHFTFTFDELMKGGGVGANYSSEYLAPYSVDGVVSIVHRIDPAHSDALDVPVSGAAGERLVFVVEDSREGWVDALRLVLDLAATPGFHTVEFDYSEVRPSGDPIKGFGGTASGPGPLAQALQGVADVLAENVGAPLSPIQAMRVDHQIAQCVVAGNVRRSARMSILHWNDPHIFDFIACKSDHSDHWSTNISVEIDDAFFIAYDQGVPHAVAVYQRATEAMLANGEPGFYNSALAGVGEKGDVRATNPCGEIALEAWESCNLGHVNLAAFVGDLGGAVEAFRLMARFLYRATFAELLDPRQAAIEAENRRIGVGFFGFQEWLQMPYEQAAESPRVAAALSLFKFAVSDEINTLTGGTQSYNSPIKSTTVAPTGTIAKLAGVTEGIHPVYSRYYERRVRYAESDPKWRELEAQGYEVEDCIYSANTKVVVFHTKDMVMDKLPENMVRQANELTLGQMLSVQALVQARYADNAVSFTANIDPSTSLAELQETLIKWLPSLKGTTIMPDASRPQSPYTRITREEYEAATDHEVGQGFDDCASGACPVR